jgi:hypothetical protein
MLHGFTLLEHVLKERKIVPLVKAAIVIAASVLILTIGSGTSSTTSNDRAVTITQTNQPITQEVSRQVRRQRVLL